MKSEFIGRKRIQPYNQEHHPETSNFLLKLYQILESNVFKGVIEWDESGKYFIIKNLNLFCEKVLPIYYKHNNFSSFVRQLNMYDFHKIRSKDNFHIYEHSLFTRDGKDQINKIKRKNNISKTNENGLIPINEHNMDNTPISLPKKVNKKSLAKTLNILVEKAKQTGSRQLKIENKIENLNEKNMELLTQNKVILQEISNKTEYNKKLESIVLFVIELLIKKPKNEKFSEISENSENGSIIKKENDINYFFQKYLDVVNKQENSFSSVDDETLENNKIDDNLKKIFGSSSSLQQDSTQNSNINLQGEDDIYLNDNDFCLNNDLDNSRDVAKNITQCFFNLNEN